jgi:hypothetical protein
LVSYTQNKAKSHADKQLIAIFGTLFRNTVNPSQFGVVLTYAPHAALGKQALVVEDAMRLKSKS